MCFFSLFIYYALISFWLCYLDKMVLGLIYLGSVDNSGKFLEDRYEKRSEVVVPSNKVQNKFMFDRFPQQVILGTTRICGC